MAIDLNIVQQRGTIFIPRFLNYNKATEAKYSNILPGAKSMSVPFPSQIATQNAQQERLIDGGVWQLVRGIERIIFYPNRVDIIKDWISPRHVKMEDEFLHLCKSVFSVIVTLEGFTASRVAYSTIFARDKDISFSDNQMWDVIFKKVSFLNSFPNEVSVIRNYRVNRLLDKRGVSFNFRSTFGSANHSLPDGTISTGSVLVTFDINSVPDINYQFNKEMLCSFFDSALGFSDEMYDYLIG